MEINKKINFIEVGYSGNVKSGRIIRKKKLFFLFDRYLVLYIDNYGCTKVVWLSKERILPDEDK